MGVVDATFSGPSLSLILVRCKRADRALLCLNTSCPFHQNASVDPYHIYQARAPQSYAVRTGSVNMLDIESASSPTQAPDQHRYPSEQEALTAQQIASWKKRRRSYILVYSSIFCIAYVTSLDANTGYLYLNFACSEFGSLASFSTIAIVQQLCYAIAKPPIAKLSDVFGRAEAYLISLSFYVAGYVVVASAPSLSHLMGGIVLQATGNTGVQVLQSIIIADSTTAKWRGLIIGIVNLPYLINFGVAGPLVEVVMRNRGWRFGFYLWTVIVPLSALPLLITLFVGQRRARNAGLMTTSPIQSRWLLPALRELGGEIDFGGLVLFSAGFVLLLVPLSEAGHGAQSTISPRLMLMASVFVLAAFVLWEGRATNPILPYRFLANISVVCICIVGVLDFCSFYLSWTYLSAFIQVLKGWDQTRTGYFASTQNVTSTLTGLLVGWAMAATRRYKTLLIVGVIVRLIGVAMMVRYRSVGSPTSLLVMCQLLQGIGGGSVAITMQVAVQCVVRHSDVAIVTAIELLMTECGAAIGSAVAGLVFSQDLPNALARRLPDVPAEDLDAIFGSLSVALSYPLGSQTRQAIIEAWVQVMHKLCIMAALILVPAIFFSFAIADGELPDVHHHHHNQRSDHLRHPSSSSLPEEHHKTTRPSRSVGSLKSSMRRAPSQPRMADHTSTDRNGPRMGDGRTLRFASDSESGHLMEENEPFLRENHAGAG